ncbi:MAG: diguanylate cyclase domain-containing protein, partial [Methylophilaceae bacterium]
MKNLGIKSRVILLGTMPAVLFAMILAGYAISNVFSVLNESIRDRGRIIASQLAPAAEYGVISGNTQILKKLAQQALANEQELRTVLVLDKQGKVLALSGRPFAEELLLKIRQENIREMDWHNGIIFVSPIYQSLVEIEDFIISSDKSIAALEGASQQEIGHVYVELSTLTLQNLRQDLMANILLIGLFGLFASALIAWMIGRNITKPIQEIAHAVNQVGEGVFSHTITENSSGELKTLQKGFNSMSLSIKNAYELMQEKIHDATALLRYQTQHDDLTGLVNRREFEVRLERCLKSAHEHQIQHVFCYLDLDQFKLVNDTCGHNAGDELLKQVSALLSNKMRERDTLARIGGDEFGLLLENCSLADASQLTNKLLKLVRDYRFLHEDKVFNIGVSIGLVVVNTSFGNISEIMHAADAACYSAKKAGRNQSFLYSHGDIETKQRQSGVAAVSDITDEIDDSQFVLYCQPILPLNSSVPQQHHYEILIRKIGLDGEITLPTTFIPSAERYHLMPNIDRWVIKNTFSAYRKLL